MPTQPLWGEVEAPKWQPNRTAWLLTCVDLTSLLVGFFVLLFSTQTLKRDKWEAVTGSFQSQFSSHQIVVPVVPDGADNAEMRVTSMKSGLAYLDTLLHQRMAKDVVWNVLRSQNGNGAEMTYAVPLAVQDMRIADNQAAWDRLGTALRGWKNPVGVRVTMLRNDATEASQKAIAMGAKLAASGVKGTFAEVRLVDAGNAQVQLVVRQ